MLPRYLTILRRYLQLNRQSNFRIADQKDQRVMTRKVVAAPPRITAMQVHSSLPIRQTQKDPTRNEASS